MNPHFTMSCLLILPLPAVTVAAGLDTFGHYLHEREPAAELDAAALEEHRLAVAAVYPDGFERAK
jgi:hypothetical protein